MVIHARASIVINRPIEDVWSYLDDEAKNQTWRGQYVNTVARLTPGPTTVGTRFQGTMRGGSYVTEITRYEPPTDYAWKYISYPSGSIRGLAGSYHLASVGQQVTRFELEESFNSAGVLGAILSVPLSLVGGWLIGNPLLRKLKTTAESQA